MSKSTTQCEKSSGQSSRERLRSEKCHIAVDSVLYQGHIFSDKGVKVDLAKT